jgi:alkylation response protein AidB-like acyl-CoA dehydrogenase
MLPDARQRGLQEDLAGVCERLDAIGPAESEAFCAHKWELVRESGILGLPFEPAFGGRGEDLITTMHVLEALGGGCADGGLTFSVSARAPRRSRSATCRGSPPARRSARTPSPSPAAARTP